MFIFSLGIEVGGFDFFLLFIDIVFFFSVFSSFSSFVFLVVVGNIRFSFLYGLVVKFGLFRFKIGRRKFISSISFFSLVCFFVFAFLFRLFSFLLGYSFAFIRFLRLRRG